MLSTRLVVSTCILFAVALPDAAMAAAPVKHPVQLQLTGTGSVVSSPSGISCPGTCAANFKQGTSITLTATPGSGESLVSWGGACSGSSATCIVANIQAAVTVSAEFSDNGSGGGGTSNATIDELNDRVTGLEASMAGLEEWLGKLTIAPEASLGADGHGNFWGGKYAFNNALINQLTGAYNVAIGEGALASQTGVSGNIAIGRYALLNNTTGGWNVAIGTEAPMGENRGGSYNTVVGSRALVANQNGQANSAFGMQAMRFLSGSENTALGANALYGGDTSSVGSKNVAIGQGALGRVIEGYDNIAIGWHGGFDLFNGSQNILIGNWGEATLSNTVKIGSHSQHHAFYAAGIYGQTVTGAGSTVVIDSDGKLGTVVSTREAKTDIVDMGDRTEKIYQLRPVTFSYLAQAALDARSIQYGLIAEEVAEVFPELVVTGSDMKPDSVAYHLLTSMLLNELQKHQKRLLEQDQRIALLESALQEIIEERESLPPQLTAFQSR